MVNKKWNNEKISILVLNNGVPTFNGSNEICRYTQTFGGNLSFKIKSTNVVSNFYFQTGESISGLDVSAFNFLLELSQRVSNNTFLVGYDCFREHHLTKHQKQIVYPFIWNKP